MDIPSAIFLHLVVAIYQCSCLQGLDNPGWELWTVFPTAHLYLSYIRSGELDMSGPDFGRYSRIGHH